MASRWSLLLASLLTLAGWAPASASVGLFLAPGSGEVFLANTGELPADVVGYSLLSASGGLLPMGWTPIAGRLDAAGDGTFDALHAWIAFPASTTDLSEGVLASPGGTLAPGGFVSLGIVWGAGEPLDLSLEVLVDGGQAVAAAATTVSLGDYDGDGNVDEDDYTVFEQTFGSTTDLRADGSGDLVIGLSDYTVWRDNLGLELSPDAMVGLLTAAPEPSALAALLLGLGAAPRGRRRG